MQKKFILIITIVVAATIGKLFFSYKNKEASETENLQFKRSISKTISKGRAVKKMKYFPDKIFASNGYIYLGNADSSRIEAISSNGRLAFTLGNNKIEPESFLNSNVDNESFREISPKNKKLSIFTKEGDTVKNIKVMFSRAIEIDSISILLKGSLKDASNEAFIIYNTETGNCKELKGLVAQNNDAGISTDGFFIKNPTNGYIFFVSYLQGSFICFDKAGKFLYKKKTVDGFSKKYRTTNKRGYTFLEPMILVNEEAASAGDFLYVLSLIKSKSDHSSKDQDIIDMYKVKDGSYAYSYYIPSYNAHKISSFCCTRNLLYAVHGKMIIMYDISPSPALLSSIK